MPKTEAEIKEARKIAYEKAKAKRHALKHLNEQKAKAEAAIGAALLQDDPEEFQFQKTILTEIVGEIAELTATTRSAWEEMPDGIWIKSISLGEWQIEGRIEGNGQGQAVLSYAGTDYLTAVATHSHIPTLQAWLDKIMAGMRQITKL